MTGQSISVGKLGKPHGLSGAFRFLLHRELKNKKKAPKYFLINKGKNPVPYFVKSIEWSSVDEGFITFEEITTPEHAKQLGGSELMLYEKDVALYLKKEDAALSSLIGYKVIDQDKGEIGAINDVLETPGQTLLSVSGKDILIPLVDDFVVEINKRKKEIILDLPEGLLDL